MLNFVIGGKQYYPLGVTYDKSMSQLGAKVKASIPLSDKGENITVELGDLVKVYEDWHQYFWGTVTSIERTDRLLTLTAYDTCYYLNRSQKIMQFTGMTVSEALAALFKECGLFNHHCPDMPTLIDTVCYIQSPAQIAKKLIQAEIDANGGEYYLDSSSFNSVDIYRVGELSSDASLTAIISPTKEESIDDMRNRVSLIVSDGTGYSVTETASDERSITKYGLLHEYVKVSSDASGAVATAQNRLRSLSRILADGTITVKGNWALTAVGKRIKITEPVSSLTGEYVITSVSHKLGDDFKTTLSLQEYKEASAFKPTIETAATSDMDAIKESREGLPLSNKLVLPYQSCRCRLTSRYGYRTHPVTGQKNSFHGGVDLVGITTDSGNGNVIVAVKSGVVIRSQIVTDKNNATWQWGNYIAVLGDDGATIYYCHLAKRMLREGQRVRIGDQIGIEGATGQVTGQHLHFEVRRGSERVNAADYLGIPNEPGTYTGINSEEVKNTAANRIIERMRNID